MDQHSPASAGLSVYTFPILVVVLVFAPLIKGGNRPIPLLILEVAAVLLLGLVIMDWTRVRAAVSPALLIILGLTLAWPLVQLFPLGESIWSKLSGRDLYLPALSAMGLTPSHHAISLVPRATEAAWLTLLPPIAVLLATLTLPRERLRTLAYVFVAIATAQALVGLAQYGTRSYSVIFAGGEVVRNAFGTYANYDHLAGLLEMALPVALGLLAVNIHSSPRKGSPPLRKSSRKARRPFEGLRTNHAAIFSAATVAILLGIIFSRSRTGIAVSMLAILASALAFGTHIGGKKSASILTVIAVIGAALAVEIGLAPVLGRFTEQSASADLRWSIFTGTWAGIVEFLPFGSGAGTYPMVFRSFQPVDVPLFVNHAHNDYLEWMMDCGLVAGLIVALAAIVFLRRGGRLVRSQTWSVTVFSQVGAAIGVIALALHSLVDFNLHIPANSIYFALLAGLSLHLSSEAAEKPKERRPASRSREPGDGGKGRHGEVPIGEPRAPERTRNPFADATKNPFAEDA